MTKISGSYAPPVAGTLRGSTVYYWRDCLKTKEEKGGLAVSLSLGPRELAVIVWE